MSALELEDRYVVLKIKDIEAYLSDEEKDALANICIKIRDARWNKRRSLSVDCVVVESDWPMYEDVVSSVLQFAKSEGESNEST